MVKYLRLLRTQKRWVGRVTNDEGHYNYKTTNSPLGLWIHHITGHPVNSPPTISLDPRVLREDTCLSILLLCLAAQWAPPR